MTNNNNQGSNKTRNLTVVQLFEILQKEYIVCELRALIYPHEKHKQYWRDLMQKKKEKIIDIAQRNSLFSIFDDKRVKVDYDKKIIPESGFPNFIYKDDTQRFLQEKWDIHNYYLPGEKVKICDEQYTTEGIIKSVDLALRSIKINTNSGLIECDLNSVTRIL